MKTAKDFRHKHKTATSKYNGVYYSRSGFWQRFGFRVGKPWCPWHICITTVIPIRKQWNGKPEGYETEREAALAADKVYLELGLYDKLNILKPVKHT